MFKKRERDQKEKEWTSACTGADRALDQLLSISFPLFLSVIAVAVLRSPITDHRKIIMIKAY